MRTLILGGGGREHALAWKLSQSKYCDGLFVAPGNAGTAMLAENIPISPLSFAELADFCREQRIDMVVPGSEEALVAGIADRLSGLASLPSLHIVGPSQAAAQLEGSKAFAKAFMQRHGIPTAAYRVFHREELEAGIAYLRQHPLPVVLKADGLAAGKGVLICRDRDEAIQQFEAMLRHEKFGQASQRVVVEQYLEGIEVSMFLFTDGHHYLLLPEAKDYKRIGEGDTGLNTGGMGAVSPVPFVDAIFTQKVETRIILPTLAGMRQEGYPYRGFLFLGLMVVNGDPYVIEYNCRLGDPETEAILPRIRNDLMEMFMLAQQGKLHQMQLSFVDEHALTLMLASGGYPGNYRKGLPLQLPAHLPEGCYLFHAGTARQQGQLVTAGGRVLAITSLAKDLPEAKAKSLQLATEVQFEGKYFRRDIGWEFLSDAASQK
ncbi:MAG: phosphoribosylamine--glycine ligase [Thermoflavifilum sp.]|nr:phosphoribosylamine--glycine ligase [Thermoflavifilum sp.]